MQLFLAFAILLLSALVASKSPPSGSPDEYENDGAKYIWGQKTEKSREFRTMIVSAGKITMRKVRRKLEISEDISRVPTIDCIEAIDISPTNDRGSVIVTEGGRGKTFVTLEFESERGKGLNFKVKLFTSQRKSY